MGLHTYVYVIWAQHLDVCIELNLSLEFLELFGFLLQSLK